MSEKSPQQIYASYRWKSRVNMILLVLLAAFVVSAFAFVINSTLTIGSLSNQTSRYFLAGAGIAIFIAEAIIWACPACNRHLGRWPFPKKCPRCGVDLRPPK